MRSWQKRGLHGPASTSSSASVLPVSARMHTRDCRYVRHHTGSFIQFGYGRHFGAVTMFVFNPLMRSTKIKEN